MGKFTFSGWLLRMYRGVIGYLFFFILAALLFLASFSTGFIDKYEMVHALPDSPWMNLFAIVIVLTVSIYTYIRIKSGWMARFVEKLNTDEFYFKRIRSNLLFFWWGILALWVVCTQVPANADQRAVLLAARAIAKRDFSAGGEASYIYLFNNQIGLTMSVYGLNRIFGEFNYVAYQLMNTVFIVLIFKSLSELGALFGMSRMKQLMLILLCIAFASLSFYCSFIYGTLPGLWLSLTAIRLEIIYFRRGNWRDALLSAIAIAIAVLLKMNYIIFAVAMVIYALVEVLSTKKAEKLCLIAFIVLFCIVQARLPIMALEHISGQPVPQGISTWAWVTMGLQDDERPGWYNGYSDYTFEASDYDRDKQEVWVKSDLKQRLWELWSDKDYARDFFVRKTASQWNEPSFQSIWISINSYQDGYGHGVISVDNTWPKAILSPQGNHAITEYLNYLNFIILAGTMLYLLLCSKTNYFHDSLILALIFIGGFLFHMVWEAKGQYALPYFVLLLPYTVLGYSETTKRVMGMISAVKNGTGVVMVCKKDSIWKLVLFVITILLLWFVFHGTMDSLTGDSEIYYNYLT